MTISPKWKKSLLWVSPVVILLLIFPSLPNPLFNQPYATTLETEQSELLGALIADDGQWRFPMQDSLPQNFVQAITLFEDEYFFNHPGINPVAIFHAMADNLKSNSFKRGGSTLSMQVIRLSRGNPSRTVWEKMKEAILALKLELFYSKEEILAFYAAHAPFGGNVVGISAASWRYYGRSPDQLSWGEVTALAVLPNSPALIFPGKNDDRLKIKRDFLLKKLMSRKVIDTLTYQLATEEPLPGQPLPLPQLAPRLLTRLVNDGLAGQRNITSIDINLQKNVRQFTESHMESLKANYVFNAAVLVTETETGRTVAYIGNIDSGAEHGQQVDIITANRSTGSLLKPFLYAAAIDEGLITPNQMLPDYPIFYEGFSPKNFDLKYRGAVQANEALTKSLNLPFVHLLKLYGYEKLHQKLQRIGMKSLDQPAQHYGLSLILGGAESNLWELTAMYSSLYRIYSRSFTRPINNQYKKSDYFFNSYLVNQKKKITSDQLNEQEISIAAAWSAFEAIKGLNRPEDYSNWPYQSATTISWKTGTSFGFRDAWAIGLNGKYTVGVWIGNADGEGRPELIGLTAAAPLMFRIFGLLASDVIKQVPMTGTAMTDICQLSGYRASENCADVVKKEIPSSSLSAEVCPHHYLLHLDDLGESQVNSSCYDVNKMTHQHWFILPPVQAWYYRQYHSDYKVAPKFLKDCESKSEKAKMELIYPRNSTSIYIPKELDGSIGRAVFEVAHIDHHEIIYWHLDGNYLGNTTRNHQMGIVADVGHHILHLLDGTGEELNLRFEVLGDEK